MRQTEQATRAVGRELMILRAGNDADPTTARSRELVAFAARQRIVTVYSQRASVAAGGLMSYGNSQPEAYRDAALYVARIVKGEKPGELPVTQPTRFELVINMKTARELGLKIPLMVIARADDVIE